MNNNIILSIKKIFKNSPNLNFLNNSCFLITGGTGMLLTYTVLFLIFLNRKKKKNIKIYLMGENIHKYRNKIKKFTPLKGLKFIKIKKEFHSNFKNLKFDFIIHAAGNGDPVEYNKNKKKLVDDNLISTINLLELAERKKIKRFIYISSGSVYGDYTDNLKAKENLVGTQDQKNLNNYYGLIKKTADNICMQFANKNLFKVNIMRPTHCYGPTYNNLNSDSRFMANVLNAIVNKKELLINGNISSKRTFTHIIDFTTALFFIIKKAKSKTFFNVGNDKNFLTLKKVLYIVKNIFYDFRYKIKNVKINKPSKMFMISKNLKELGWKPFISVKDGVQESVSILRSLKNFK